MTVPSKFTRGARTLALGSWGAAAAIPMWSVAQLIKEVRERSEKRAAQGTVRRATGGCANGLAILLLGGTIYMFMAVAVFTLVLMVAAAVGAFALLVTLAWGGGVVVDRRRQRPMRAA